MLAVQWVGELAAAASFGGAFPGASGVDGDAVSAVADYDRRAAVALYVGHGSIVSPGVKFGGVVGRGIARSLDYARDRPGASWVGGFGVWRVVAAFFAATGRDGASRVPGLFPAHANPGHVRCPQNRYTPGTSFFGVTHAHDSAAHCRAFRRCPPYRAGLHRCSA